MFLFLNGHKLEFDESLTYADFSVNSGKPEPTQIDMKQVLAHVESGKFTWEMMKNEFRMWSRWVEEAPRKRFFRHRILAGDIGALLSTEFFFHDWEKGEEFIDCLENTGKLAARVLECFNTKPAKSITNTNPFHGVSDEEILSE